MTDPQAPTVNIDRALAGVRERLEALDGKKVKADKVIYELAVDVLVLTVIIEEMRKEQR